MDSFDIQKYLDMAARRKYWIIIPFLLVILAGLSYGLVVPKIYEAETLILVQSQKVPEEYVRSIIPGEVEHRLKTITQQVMSRTNLEKIIKEHKLDSEFENADTMEETVLSFRKKIRIDVSHGGRDRRGQEVTAFTIAFQGKEPVKVMQVTNALASNFMSENLKMRESQAIGTSTFLADELQTLEKRLADKEEILKQYREKYMGGLPEQLETNLSILERLEEQMSQLNSNLRDAENRKIVIQQQVEEAKRSTYRPPSEDEDVQDLDSLKNQLAALEAKYTAKHPDVIRLKKIIEGLESKDAKTESDSALGTPVRSRTGQTLTEQVGRIDLEIKSLKDEILKVKSQTAWYQARVEETPKREQELLTLQRDYENLKGLYSSLLNRKLEAEIAVSMEKKQKGEQFRILDPAKIPMRPIKPDVRKTILLTLLLGMALGCGLAYGVEIMDTSYKIPEDVEKELGLPVLISMPIRYTEKELKIQKAKGILKAVSVAVGFLFCAVGIVFVTKGVNETINFTKTFLTNLGVL